MGLRTEQAVPVGEDRDEGEQGEHTLPEAGVEPTEEQPPEQAETAEEKELAKEEGELDDEAIPFPDDEDDSDPFQKQMAEEAAKGEAKEDDKGDQRDIQAEPPKEEREQDQGPLEGQQPAEQQPAEEQQQAQEQAVQLPEGFDEALSPLYQANPEKAQEVHQALYEQKELLSHGVPLDGLKTYAQRHQEVIERVNTADRLEGEIEKAKAYAQAGNIDKVAEVLGLDPEAMEKYYTEKRDARDTGELSHFEARYSQTEKEAQMALENLQLRRQVEASQQQSNQSAAKYWNDRISQDPDTAGANQLMGDPLYSQKVLERNFASLPENQRTIENAFLKTVEEMKVITSRFGGMKPQAQTAQAPVQAPQASVQSQTQALQTPAPAQRPAGIRPPSQNVPNRSTIAGRKSPRNIEEWARM